MLKANDPHLHSWIQIPPASEFPIQNLPFGIFSTENHDPRVGVAIGEYILDLCVLAQDGLFDLLDVDPTVFNRDSLNDFIRLGKPAWRAVRDRVSELLRNDNGEIRDNDYLMHRCLIKQAEAFLHIPVKISKYTHFYNYLEPDSALNQKIHPSDEGIGTSKISLPANFPNTSPFIIGGSLFYTPPLEMENKSTPPSQELLAMQPDFKLELGYISGALNMEEGSLLTADDDYPLFGIALLLSRPSQFFETSDNNPSQPIFKSYNTQPFISPWIITSDALETFRVPGPKQASGIPPYLNFSGNKNLDFNFSIFQSTSQQNFNLVRELNTSQFYWNINQQLAHFLNSGSTLQAGDVIGSGTFFTFSTDSIRKESNPGSSFSDFIKAENTIIIKGQAIRAGLKLGFGEIRIKQNNHSPGK